jgi:hypothetical protein
MGWGAPGNGRPPAPREAGRGAARSGGVPAWEAVQVVLGRLEDRAAQL